MQIKIITICGSMTFAKEMLYCKELLEKHGHIVLVPGNTDDYAFGRVNDDPASKRKIQHGLIKKHFEKIDASNAILVLNLLKNGIEYYIGANTFLEMGVAFRRGIKIFLLNPIPDNPYIWDEVVAMQPIVLFGDCLIRITTMWHFLTLPFYPLKRIKGKSFRLTAIDRLSITKIILLSL